MIPPQPLTNFEIQIYYQGELRFNGVYSRDKVPNKMKKRAYVINLDENIDIGTHWIALYVNSKTITYFDSIRVEHIPKEIKRFINNKDIKRNFQNTRISFSNVRYFCTGLIYFMFKGNNLTDFTNNFSPNNLKKK